MARRIFGPGRCLRCLPALAAIVASITFIATLTAFAHDISDEEKRMTDHPYAGMWVTEDNHVRHELLPNGRYVEARGTRERAYEGQYWVNGDHIDYKDDTGFTADGDFRDGVLHHGGMVFRRK
jgi:hypothetical protein